VPLISVVLRYAISSRNPIQSLQNRRLCGTIICPGNSVDSRSRNWHNSRPGALRLDVRCLVCSSPFGSMLGPGWKNPLG
jgi:hypothetical protein